MKNALFLCVLLTLFPGCKSEEKPNYLDLGIQPQIHRFSLDQSSDAIIKGPNGTLVEIRKNSFVNELGDPVKVAEITLEEFYTVEDFIKHRLSTKTTDGRLLKSSGMININASSNGEEVFLKEGATIKLGFPRIQNSRVANLFKGVQGPHEEVIWELEEPVHLDTTVYRRESWELLKYGAHKVTIYLSAVVGYDTVDINDDNIEIFSKYSTIDIYDYPTELDTSYNEVYKQERPALENKYYLFEAANLGWINCDIFINEELHPFAVKTKYPDSDVFIVLDSLNSVIYPDYDPESNDAYKFSLPEDLSITIVGYTFDEDLHLFGLSTTNTSQEEILLHQEPKELPEIEKTIKELG